ncbi:MAG: S8 family serine peptidase [Bacteroidales bacterium]|nr:S8 family serine peptidase [Bacteroidales bacterium]
MKKVVLFCVLLMGVVSMQAQRAMLSPSAALKVMEIRNGRCQAENLHAFVTLAEGADLKAFDAYGVKVNSVVKGMMTVQIPTKRFAEFAASGLCSYIDLGQENHLYLENARADLGIDYIHNGINLPQGYDGTGVVVGVIDVGFDYSHPTYYDTTGTTLRIKRVWQQLDNSGTAPEGFSYGSEYATPEAILAAGTDLPNQGHGSHTSGIAAGSGGPASFGQSYRGMAPAADIVLVGSTLQDPTIFDGIRYIHEYAQSVGKPCVINMSLGSVIGPHDGTDPISLMINGLLRDSNDVAHSGTILVASASNNGNSMRHLHKHFSAIDTMVYTYLSSLQSGSYSSRIACWGAVGDTFSISLGLYDFDSRALVMDSPLLTSTVDTTFSIDFTSPLDNVYHCDIAVSHDNPNNHRPSISLYLYSEGRHTYRDLFRITVKSTSSADVHLWGEPDEFYKSGEDQAVQGDYDYLIGGVGANGDNVISVGSYSTRIKLYDDEGNYSSLDSREEGDLSYFSSHGPTWDGRVKPDICAPGQYLISAINADYVPDYRQAAGNNFVTDSILFGGEMHYYALMQGTSMSSPAAAGIIALWLQRNPNLNVDSVRTLLHNSGRSDRFTGVLPAEGSNLWGWGKIDAFAGLPATSVPMHYVDAYSDNPLTGHTTGRGRHPEGQHTIEALPTMGYAFDHWTNNLDDITDNPFTFNLVSDTLFVAHFEETPCDTISQFPWEPVFTEGTLNCWENYSPSGSSQAWYLYQGTMLSVGMATAGGPDALLITPPVRVQPQTALFYNATSSSQEPNFDSLSIVVINAHGDTVALYPERLSTDNSGEFIVSLTPYVGQVVKLGFYHHACGTMGIVRLLGLKIDHHVGIDDVDNPQLQLSVNGLRVTLSGAPEAPVNIFDVMGRCVLSSPVANGTFSLPADGIYIVRVGDLPARKIVVVR